MNFFSLPKTEEAAIKFLQSKNILPTNKICENGHEMKLSIGEQISWQCSKSTCRSEVNIRVGNWLEGSHIPIVTIVRFIYAWAIGMTAVNNKFCERELEMNSKTTNDWKKKLLSICVEHVVNKQKNQDGENMAVEIDRNRAEFMCRKEVKKEDFFEWILEKIAEIRAPK